MQRNVPARLRGRAQEEAEFQAMRLVDGESEICEALNLTWQRCGVLLTSVQTYNFFFSLPPTDLESNIVCNNSSLTSVLEQLSHGTESVSKNKTKCKGHFMHSLGFLKKKLVYFSKRLPTAAPNFHFLFSSPCVSLKIESSHYPPMLSNTHASSHLPSVPLHFTQTSPNIWTKWIFSPFWVY